MPPKTRKFQANYNTSPFTKKIKNDNDTLEMTLDPSGPSEGSLFANSFAESIDLNNNLFISPDSDSKKCFRTQLEPIDFLQFSLLVDCLRDSVPVWDSISERALSTIIYMLLRNSKSLRVSRMGRKWRSETI